MTTCQAPIPTIGSAIYHLPAIGNLIHNLKHWRLAATVNIQGNTNPDGLPVPFRVRPRPAVRTKSANLISQTLHRRVRRQPPNANPVLGPEHPLDTPRELNDRLKLQRVADNYGPPRAPDRTNRRLRRRLPRLIDQSQPSD